MVKKEEEEEEETKNIMKKRLSLYWLNNLPIAN